MRSRSSEAARQTSHRQILIQRKVALKKEDRSEIESLAEEHRKLIFWLLKESRKNLAAIARRTLLLLIAAGLLLASLALIVAILHLGTGIGTLAIRRLLVIGDSLAALLLVATIALALYGAASALPPKTMLPLPAQRLSRQEVFILAQEDLSWLKKLERRSGSIFRAAAFLFLAALLPYLFVLILLAI